MTNTLHQTLGEKHLLPKAHLPDRGSVHTAVLIDRQEHHGVAVSGPLKVDTTWQAQAGQGVDVSCFTIDWEPQRVTCPKGQPHQVWADSKDNAGNPRVSVRFATASCQACPGRADGTRSAAGPRPVSVKPRPLSDLLQGARHSEQTAEFQARYKKRAGSEGPLAQGTRAFGLRRSRYIGQAQTQLQHMLLAVAITLARFVAWITEVPLAVTRTSAFAALATAQI